MSLIRFWKNHPDSFCFKSGECKTSDKKKPITDLVRKVYYVYC